jgi:hypothetical protein
MIELPPSNLHEYALIWEGDSALSWETPPERPARVDDETDEAYTARDDVKAWAESVDAILKANASRYLTAALETGKWDGLLKEGEKPCIFRVRQVPARSWNALATWKAHRQPSDEEYYATVFRAGVVAIDGAPQGVRVSFDEQHKNEAAERTGIGKVLADSTVDAIHAINKRIVFQVGALIAMQRGGPLGK